MPYYEVTVDVVRRNEVVIVVNAANEDELKKNLAAGKYEGSIEDEAWAAYRIDLSEHESSDVEIISVIPLDEVSKKP